jgi:hypothetical protein
VVLPDEAPAPTERAPLGRRAVIGIAAAALTLGALTLGALTTPEPVAMVETTTTTSTIADLEQPIDWENFTVDQIAVGDQLDWRKVAQVQGGARTTLVSQLGLLYLFTSSQVSADREPIGLHVYRSLDGWNWEDLGVIADDGIVTSVGATPFGLMAIESNRDDGSVAAWRSTDAMDWDRTVIDQTRESKTFLSSAIGASSSLVVVAGSIFDDGSSLLEDKLADYGLELDLSTLNWNIDSYGENATIVFYGPLGIQALSIPVSELGITEEESLVLQRGMVGDGNATVWSTHDGTTWATSSIDGVDWVSSITPSPDGGVLLFGSDSAGQAAWRSYDGVNWEKLGFGLRADRAVPWHGRLVGLSAEGTPEVFLSQNGEEWQGLGLGGQFPSRIGWYPTQIATSDAVIAVTVQGYPSDSPPAPEQRREPTVLQRNGTTLTLDLDQGLIEFYDGESIRTWRAYAPLDSSPEGLVIDLEQRTFTFLDSAGSELVTFGFDELQQAEMKYYLANAPGDFLVDALAYTINGGATWAIQDLDQAFGNGNRVVDMIATPFALMAVIQPSEVYFGSGQGELQIWVAPLPSR